jgi:hypothetical protein
MWILNPESVAILGLLAKDCSSEDKQAETLQIFIDGFSTYEEEAINKLAGHPVVKERRFYDSWGALYRDRWRMLLENIGRVGQTAEQAFLSASGRAELCLLVSRVDGVRVSDVEDIVQEVSFKFSKGYDLRLMSSLGSMDDFPTKGKNLIVVVAAAGVLHFRIFDSGVITLDTNETELPDQAGSIEDLRQQLAGLWLPHVLTDGEKKKIVPLVTSIVEHPFAKGDYAERYNPLVAPWRNYLLEPIRRHVITYYKRKNTRVLPGVVSLDKVNEQSDSGRTLAASLHDPDQDGFPGYRLLEAEIRTAWEKYLGDREPIRVSVRNISRKLCTLIPPGIVEIPTTVEIHVFFLQGGVYNSRVTTRELYGQGVFPTVANQLLVDYISEDPVTHAQYVDVLTGEFITQKDFPNPHPDPALVLREQRTWMEFYTLLMQGLQADEIARALKLAPTSMSGRLRKLEALYHSFWLVSDMVPQGEIKLRAAKTYRCPRCHRLDVIQRDECPEPKCGANMQGEVPKIRFKDYPWGRVRVTRATFVRLGEGEPKIKREQVWSRRGSISSRF